MSWTVKGMTKEEIIEFIEKLPSAIYKVERNKTVSRDKGLVIEEKEEILISRFTCIFPDKEG